MKQAATLVVLTVAIPAGAADPIEEAQLAVLDRVRAEIAVATRSSLFAVFVVCSICF